MLPCCRTCRPTLTARSAAAQSQVLFSPTWPPATRLSSPGWDWTNLSCPAGYRSRPWMNCWPRVGTVGAHRRNIPPSHTVPVKCEPSAPSVPPSTGVNCTMPGEPADTSTPAHTANELVAPAETRHHSRRLRKQNSGICLRSRSDLENDEANSNHDSRPKTDI